MGASLGPLHVIPFTMPILFAILGKPCGVDSPSGMQIQFVGSRNRINAAGTESTMAWFTPSIYDHRSTTALRHAGLLAAQTSALAVHCPWISVSSRACRLAQPWRSTIQTCHGPGCARSWHWHLRRLVFGPYGGHADTRRLLAFAGLFLIVLVWWISIRPSHHRPWRPEVAVMPRAIIDGDRVHITGVRDFEYRTKDDFTVRYQERDVWLSSLTSIDFFISYWAPGPVGHTFLSFNFDNALPVCISIETRPEVGEGFDPIASLFKQFELIYVVGDERDIVRVRTNFRHDDVYLYRIRTTPENARRLFLIYP